MHDACPNDVSYMCPKSPKSGGFVRPPLEVPPAGCSQQVSQCFKPLQSSLSKRPQQSKVVQTGHVQFMLQRTDDCTPENHLVLNFSHPPRML